MFPLLSPCITIVLEYSVLGVEKLIALIAPALKSGMLSLLYSA